MVTHTNKTIRVTEISQDVKNESFVEAATRLGATITKKPFFTALGSSSVPLDQIKSLTSLATQFEGQVGTITLPSRSCKKKVLTTHGTGWAVDDIFDGVTILHSPLKPDLDLCAVHGLNGNAFDTWASGSIMWLRDLLPHTPPFDQARIITFGYNSTIADRESLQEKSRPIILICHSLGGLVAREAMIRLNSSSSLFDNINLQQCALLFLSTPHSGSTEADWNKYLVGIAELGFGVRSNAIVDALRSFNPQSAYRCEDFKNMTLQPPYICFHETRATSVGGLNRHIVSLASASLNGQAALPIPEVDHRSIARYESKVNGGYRLIVKGLNDLKGKLNGQDTSALRPKLTIGRSLAVAPRYPNPAGRMFYAGQGLRLTSKLKGREQEHGKLEDLLTQAQEEYAAIAVSGIGGIGKTEVLLETAYQRLDLTNIFLLRASNEGLLQDSYLNLATHIGPEILLHKYHGRDTRDIWSKMPREEKVENFKDWMSHPDNAETLVILDDLDGLGDPEIISAALPRGVKSILFSTRCPSLHEEVGRECHHLRLCSMEIDDIINIMEATVKQSDYEQDGELYDHKVLREIAFAIQGHPLAALNAVKYIIRVISQEPVESPAKVFLSMFNNKRHEARAEFLGYKPRSPSVMDTFCVSRNRLNDPNGFAWKLMQFLSVLETDTSVVDYRAFFYKHECIINPANFPDYELLSSPGPKLSKAFAELEAVSFGERTQTSKPLRFHPLWLECTRHSMGAEARFNVLRQVLLICYQVINVPVEDEAIQIASNNFLPHVYHCEKICESFGINVSQLGVPDNILKWLNSIVKVVST